MLKIIPIVLVSTFFVQAHAASLPNTMPKTKANDQKGSLIEKALTQKQENPELNANSLKLMTTIKTKPSQSILAAQNQSFSRFVQSLFSSNS
jgi:hypothetical protein